MTWCKSLHHPTSDPANPCAGETLTDDEINELDAAEAAAKAETQQDAEGAGNPPDGGMAEEAAEMMAMPEQFVLGHLTVARHSNWDEAHVRQPPLPPAHHVLLA